MCGIFGYIGNKKGVEPAKVKKRISKLFLLSESRGKEAAGIAIKYNGAIKVYKDQIPANKMIKEKSFKEFYEEAFPNGHLLKNFSLIGHSRLVTNGSAETPTNNQPVIKNGFVTVHNGIVANVNELYKKNSDIERKYEVDTEIILDLLRKYFKKENSIVKAIQKTYKDIEGTASILVLSNDFDKTILATNNASLYVCPDKERKQYVYASERYILQEFCKGDDDFDVENISWVKPFSGVIIDERTIQTTEFNFKEQKEIKIRPLKKEIVIKDLSKSNSNARKEKIVNHDKLKKLLEYDVGTIQNFKKCSKCILPEQFPYIDFDEKGVCNFCRTYERKVNFTKKEEQKKNQELRKIAESYKRKAKNGIDIIVPFSGGRDSSYGLHYIKNELGLNPITFTYDWGMVTDLARRNVARMCGKLGIENIIVSADIKKKRENIRKNVQAWLKKPNLGIIPLFMAGDKQFFHYMNKIKKQTGVDFNIWMGNRLEITNFKTGFCKIPPKSNKKNISYLNLADKIRLAKFYSQNYFLNPSYFNSSIIDTLGAYFSYYIEPRKDYYLLYDYVRWDEDTIQNTLINEYNWETSPDTESTWRIGDGTASFYNYIYLTIAGFSEIDTFRSNQIREGMITREKALELVAQENTPRYESMKWYLDIINVDFEQAIERINSTSRLYKKQ